MFDRLGAFVAQRWPWVLLFWVVLAVGIHLVAPRWNDVTQDGDFAYLPSEMTSVQGERLLEDAFPDRLSKSTIVLVVGRTNGPLTVPDIRIADRLIEALTPEEDDSKTPILDVLSYRTEVVGEKLTSPPEADGQAVLILLPLRTEFMAISNMRLVEAIYETLREVRSRADFPDALEIGVTGSAAIGADMLDSADQSIRNTEWTTLAMVLMILLIVYRSPGLVLIPLVTIGVSVWVATDLVALVTQTCNSIWWLDFKIFKTTRIFVVVILFGAGIDYCLFLISRYREELERGVHRRPALARALSGVGDALFASALTTILGLGTLVFASFGKFRYSGPAIALCLGVALSASITLAPALLRATGRVVFWPFGVQRRTTSAKRTDSVDRLEPGRFAFRRFWDKISSIIIAYPGRIMVLSMLLLGPLVYHGLSVNVTYDLLSELQSDRESVKGTYLLRRYFPAGETGPVVMLAYQKQSGFDNEKDRWEKIEGLHDELANFSYVDSHGDTVRPIVRVRSLIEPLGEPSQKHGLSESIRKGVLRGHSRTQATYLAEAPEYAGKVTRFDLVFQYDPFSIESIRLLDFVEQYVDQLASDPKSKWHATEFHFVGTTAGIRDLREVTTSDQRRIQILVPIAVLFVLIVILRRPIICIYLILSVLIGYFVTIGITKLVFASMYGETFHGLDWKVPIFLFVILVAIGQDYNIYLTTRVFEEQKRRGPIEGLRIALVRTGGIITSCGLIMAGTFVSMTTGTLRAMHELGFALSLGVLLDTFVIRTILVPAFLILWERHWIGRNQSNPAVGKSGRGEVSCSKRSSESGESTRD